MRRHVLKLLLAILVTAITYTLLGSVGGSYLVEHQLRKMLAGRDDRSLAIGGIFFNPFTFSATLEQLQLSDAVGATILTVNDARLNFSAATLLERRMVLSEVSLEQPELSLEIVATPGKSLAQVFGNPVPDIRIEKGSVHEGLVFFREGSAQRALPASAAAPFEAILSGINLQIDHYQSRSEEPASLVLSASIDQSSTLELKGHLIPLTGALETQVQLEDLDLARFGQWLNPNTTKRLSGVLQADGMLSLEVAEVLFSGDVEIQKLEARTAPNNPPFFSASELRLSHADVSAWPLRASTRFMELTQPQFELDWQQLAGSPGDAAGTPVLLQWMTAMFGPAAGSATGNTDRMPSWPPAIDAFALTGGHVILVAPGQAKKIQIELNNVTGGIVSRADDHFPATSRTVNMQLNATLDESGPVSLASIVLLDAGQTDGGSGSDSLSERNSVRSSVGAIDLQQVDAAQLPDDLTGFLARDITSGMLDLDVRYQLKDDALAISSMVSLQDLLLAGRAGPASGFDHSLDLAVALLKDPSGLISFELPLLERRGDATGAIKAALTGFISDVAANPFDLLANLAGASRTVLDFVDFEPGSAAITPVAEESLRALSVALSKRPALGIHASGGQARQADRTALARQQMQLHVALAASTRPSGRREQTALNFSDPKVQVVLDEFASERLDQDELARLKKSAAGDSNTGDATGPADQDAYYADVFAALVAREQVSDGALRQLARFRTQSVIRRLEDLGIATDRLKFGGTLEAGDQPVSLEVFAQDAAHASPPL